MIPSKNSDHVDEAIDRVIEHFSGPDKPVLRGLIRSHVEQIQGLEGAAWEVLWGRLLDPAPGRTEKAVGVQLNVLGTIVGASREGLDDDHYREAIRLQVRINQSFGTPEDLLHILRLAVGTGAFEYHEEWHHVFYTYIQGVSVVLAFVVFRSLQKARAAGTRAVFEYYTDRIDASRVFRWANGNISGGTGGNGGFGDQGNASSGGLLTSIQG